MERREFIKGIGGLFGLLLTPITIIKSISKNYKEKPLSEIITETINSKQFKDSLYDNLTQNNVLLARLQNKNKIK